MSEKTTVVVQTYAESYAYNARALKVTINGLVLWFSYNTVVAFATPGHVSVVSENIFSRTTGKHLNYLAAKDERTPREAFERQLQAALDEHGISITVGV